MTDEEKLVAMGCDLLNARQVIAMLLRYVHDDAGSMEAKRHAIKRARFAGNFLHQINSSLQVSAVTGDDESGRGGGGL